MAMKICRWKPCSKPFKLKWAHQTHCSPECAALSRRETTKKYRASAKYQEYLLRLAQRIAKKRNDQ